ncbi:MAG: hypothetical protein KGY50_01500 [Candidatus Thermoplasmatota archaeon]|nr:hypothetical protein [Candidatus Thermoplasmatota archaeon]
MATTTITLSEKTKRELNQFSWVNWSEIARIAVLKEAKKQERFAHVEKILMKSTLNDEDVKKLADEASNRLAKRYQKKLRQS